jgi:hypothetical protein
MKGIMKLLTGATSIANLDTLFVANEAEIKAVFTITSKVNGVGLRIATAVVILDPDGEKLYLYRRTPEGDERRGISGNWETFKGRVKYVDKGKCLVPEDQISGKVVGIGLATETRLGGKYAEHVHMPTVLFQVDEAGKALLDEYADKVPADMGDVAGYEWVPVAEIVSDNAMTKILVAADLVRELQK